MTWTTKDLNKRFTARLAVKWGSFLKEGAGHETKNFNGFHTQ